MAPFDPKHTKADQRTKADRRTKANSNTNPATVVAEESTFFSTAYIEETSSLRTESDGDLWPCAWSDDGYLYAANGDGKGFDLSSEWADVVVNRVSGHPQEGNIRGERLASEAEVSPLWGDVERYNRKPTGMISVDGDLYLAVQELNKDKKRGHTFSDVPQATIVKSTDKGRTWHIKGNGPMFSDYVCTTIMFLDYGRDGKNNTFDPYVYAYALDYNWRASYSKVVPDPTKLYLARLKKEHIQDRDAWQFYTGDLQGNAAWSRPGDIDARQPVLQDERIVYNTRIHPGLREVSVISQGSIVFNKPLQRYIYTSWTEYTFEFYEAPTPWGPWKRFLSQDFGVYPWTNEKHGGYATVIPSKYISNDGRTMWVNSQTFAGQHNNYHFSLRRLQVTPYEQTTPQNGKSAVDLAAIRKDAGDDQVVTPIARAVHRGNLHQVNDTSRFVSEDSWNDLLKEEDYWGVTWSHAYNMNQVVYTTGEMSAKGGWFETLNIQVRQHFQWVDVTNRSHVPTYACNSSVGSYTTYTFTFDETWGDGVRIIGKPGGEETYTSIAGLSVYYT